MLTPDDVTAQADAWIVNLFTGAECEPFALAPGRPDRVRTATPTLQRRVASASELGAIDLSGTTGPSALEVRAVDEDDTPLAGRCLGVSRFTEGGRIRLLRLAPPGATFEILSRTALRAANVEHPAKVRVLDADGEPVPGVLVSSGPAFALVETKEDGIASVGTPTTTPGADVELAIEVYGIAGAAERGRATVLPAASCPIRSGALPLFVGGPPHLAAADDVVVVSRRDAGIGRFAVYRPPGAVPALVTVASGTVASAGPVAVRRDPRDGRYTIAIGGTDGTIDVVRFDPERATLTPAAALSAAALAPAGIDTFHTLALATTTATGGLDLFASAAGLVADVIRFGAGPAPGVFGPPAALASPDRVDADQIAVADLLEAPGPEVVLGSRAGLAVVSVAGVELARGPSDVAGDFSIGGLHRREDLRPDVVVGDRMSASPRLVTLRASPELTVASVTALPDRGTPYVDDLNGDDLPDVLALGDTDGAHSLVLGDGRGHLMRVATCDDLPGALATAAADLDRDGRREWMLVTLDATQIVVLSRRTR